MTVRPFICPFAVVFLLCATSIVAGCSVVVRGSSLSSRPDPGRGIYMSTGGAPRPFRTLGFAQVRAQGVEVAGVVDAGEAVIDSAIRGSLADTAAKMGGDGVIHIEFLDENPSTPAERTIAFIGSIMAILGGDAPQDKARYVLVTGEVIQMFER